MVWHIGNTTVRTPYRLREALVVLQETPLNGNLHGRDQEAAFAHLLHEEEVVNVQRIKDDSASDVSDLGRKWRSALSQLGFITHKINAHMLKEAHDKLNLLPLGYDEITPNGYRLIESEPVAAQQETFLRSLCAYKIPSPIERAYKVKPFNPLKFVIDVIYKLNEMHVGFYLHFVEFALFVQTANPENDIEAIAKEIIAFRKRQSEASGTLNRFYQKEYNLVVIRSHPAINSDKISIKAQTLNDYADLTLRYLKATGLFKNRSRGIVLNPAKKAIADSINSTPEKAIDDVDYVVNLWNGAPLPTDNQDVEKQVIANLTKQIVARGETVKLVNREDISVTRYKLEERLTQLEEMGYYKQQAAETSDICAWMEAFTKDTVKLPTGDTIRIPRAEGPAYLEWVIWRAFLAINSLVNMPWESRRFQIDQDFLPISTAPGNGPDMVFEFKDVIIVVEVTLTSSSRQEAAEGETVRRHVAKYAEKATKAIYGLFLAPTIDNNTAHTFRTGDWYLKDGSKINLHIVPITLQEFHKLFVFGTDRLADMPIILKNILRDCRMQANNDAPTWKTEIRKIIEQETNSSA